MFWLVGCLVGYQLVCFGFVRFLQTGSLAVLKLNVYLRMTLNFRFSSLSFAADEVACLCGHALLRNAVLRTLRTVSHTLGLSWGRFNKYWCLRPGLKQCLLPRTSRKEGRPRPAERPLGAGDCGEAKSTLQCHLSRETWEE